MQISYVIPAYNCAKTIQNTVKSIIKYSINLKYEIIIVENGSTDGTAKILSSMSKVYETIKIFKSEKGVSKARNKGIKEASGKWIWFVDADDEICFNVQKILNQVSDVDFIMGNYKINRKNVELVNTNNSLSGLDYQRYRLFMISNPTRYMTVWTKIFNLNIIKRYNLKFDEKLKVAEDSNFTVTYLLKANSIQLIDECMYSYSTIGGSTMRTIDLNKINEYTKAMVEIEKIIPDTNVDLKNAIYKYISFNFFVSMVRNLFADSSLNWKCKLSILKEVKDKKIYQKAFKHVSINDVKEYKKLIPVLFLKNNIFLIPAVMFDVKARFNRRNENKVE